VDEGKGDSQGEVFARFFRGSPSTRAFRARANRAGTAGRFAVRGVAVHQQAKASMPTANEPWANMGQAALATLASLAAVATRNLYLAGRIIADRVRIPPSPPAYFL
jgi:hypothetical protein